MSTNIAFYFLESDFCKVILSKNQFPGFREFPVNRICIPAFPGMTKWLSRGNTSRNRGSAGLGRARVGRDQHSVDIDSQAYLSRLILAVR
jgi:hypothetical protein